MAGRPRMRLQVGESVAKPQLYYKNNIMATMVLLELMEQYGCKRARETLFGASVAFFSACSQWLAAAGP